MNQEILKELFVEQLRDILDAEKQLVKALPKLAKAAESEDLTEALRSHLEETQNHVTRLEEVFGMVGVAARAKPCKGMRGLIEEGNEAVQEEDEGRRPAGVERLRNVAPVVGAGRRDVRPLPARQDRSSDGSGHEEQCEEEEPEEEASRRRRY